MKILERFNEHMADLVMHNTPTPVVICSIVLSGALVCVTAWIGF